MAERILRYRSALGNQVVFTDPTNIENEVSVQQILTNKQYGGKNGITMNSRRFIYRDNRTVSVKPCPDECSLISEICSVKVELVGTLLNKETAKQQLTDALRNIFALIDDATEGLLPSLNATNLVIGSEPITEISP